MMNTDLELNANNLDEDNQMEAPLELAFNTSTNKNNQVVETPDDEPLQLSFSKPNAVNAHFREQSTNINPDEYSKYVGEKVFDTPMLNYARAVNQSNWDQFGNSLVRMVGSELIAGTIESIGALTLGAPSITALVEDEKKFGNIITEIGTELRQATDKAFPIYQENPGLANQWGDPGWWFENSISVASTLSMLIPGYGASFIATRALRAAGKAMRGAKALDAIGDIQKLNTLNKASKVSRISKATPINKLGNKLLSSTADKITKFATMPTAMRHAENYREATSVGESVRDESLAITEDMTDSQFNTYVENLRSRNPEIKGSTKGELADYLGSVAAARSYKVNASNIIFDTLQVAPFIKGFGLTRGLGNSSRSSIFNIGGIRPISKKLLKAHYNAIGKKFTAATNAKRIGLIGSIGAVGALSEGAEEFVNYVGEKEGRYLAKALALGIDVDKDNSSLYDRLISEYSKDGHAWEQFFWGSVGGATFTSVMAGIDKISDIRTNKKLTANSNSLSDQQVAYYKDFEKGLGEARATLDSIDDETHDEIKTLKKDNEDQNRSESEIKKQVEELKDFLTNRTIRKVGYMYGGRAAKNLMVDLGLEHLNYILNKKNSLKEVVPEVDNSTEAKTEEAKTEEKPPEQRETASPLISEALGDLLTNSYKAGAKHQTDILQSLMFDTDKRVAELLKYKLVNLEEALYDTQEAIKDANRINKGKLEIWDKELSHMLPETSIDEMFEYFGLVSAIENMTTLYNNMDSDSAKTALSKKITESKTRLAELEKHKSKYLVVRKNITPFNFNLQVVANAGNLSKDLLTISKLEMTSPETIKKQEENLKDIKKVEDLLPKKLASKLVDEYTNDAIIDDNTTAKHILAKNEDVILNKAKESEDVDGGELIAKVEEEINKLLEEEKESRNTKTAFSASREKEISDALAGAKSTIKEAEGLIRSKIAAADNQVLEDFADDYKNTSERLLKYLKQRERTLKAIQKALGDNQNNDVNETLLKVQNAISKFQAEFSGKLVNAERLILQSVMDLNNLLHSKTEEGQSKTPESIIDTIIEAVAIILDVPKSSVGSRDVLDWIMRLDSQNKALEKKVDLLIQLINNSPAIGKIAEDISSEELYTEAITNVNRNSNVENIKANVDFLGSLVFDDSKGTYVNNPNKFDLLAYTSKLKPGAKLSITEKQGELIIKQGNRIVGRFYSKEHLDKNINFLNAMLDDTALLTIFSNFEVLRALKHQLNNKTGEAATKAMMEIIKNRINVITNNNSTKSSEILAQLEAILEAYSDNRAQSIKFLLNTISYNLSALGKGKINHNFIEKQLAQFKEINEIDKNLYTNIYKELELSKTGKITVQLRSATPGAIIKPEDGRLSNVLDVTNTNADSLISRIFISSGENKSRELVNLNGESTFLKKDPYGHGSHAYIQLPSLNGTYVSAKLRFNSFSNKFGIENRHKGKFSLESYFNNVAFPALMTDLIEKGEVTDLIKSMFMFSESHIHVDGDKITVKSYATNKMNDDAKQKPENESTFSIEELREDKAKQTEFKAAVKETRLNIGVETNKELFVKLVQIGALGADFTKITDSDGNFISNFGLIAPSMKLNGKSTRPNLNQPYKYKLSIQSESKATNNNDQHITLSTATNSYLMGNEKFHRTSTILDLIYGEFDSFDGDNINSVRSQLISNLKTQLRGNLIHAQIDSALSNTYDEKKQSILAAELEGINNMLTVYKQLELSDAEIENIRTYLTKLNNNLETFILDLVTDFRDKGYKFVRSEVKVANKIDGINIGGSIDIRVQTPEGKLLYIDIKTKDGHGGGSNFLAALKSEDIEHELVDRAADQLRIYKKLDGNKRDAEIHVLPILVNEDGTILNDPNQPYTTTYDVSNRRTRLGNNIAKTINDTTDENKIVNKLVSAGLPTKYAPLVRAAYEATNGELKVTTGKKGFGFDRTTNEVQLTGDGELGIADFGHESKYLTFLTNSIHELIHAYDINSKKPFDSDPRVKELVDKLDFFNGSLSKNEEFLRILKSKSNISVESYLNNFISKDIKDVKETLLTLITTDEKFKKSLSDTIDALKNQYTETETLGMLLAVLYNEEGINIKGERRNNELPAYALSNIRFATFLNNVEYSATDIEINEKKPTIWDRLLFLLTEIFENLNLTLNTKSALAQMLHILNSEVKTSSNPKTIKTEETITTPEETITEEETEKNKQSDQAKRVLKKKRKNRSITVESQDLLENLISNGSIRYADEKTDETCLAHGGSFGFTRGSKWNIIKDFKGASHAKGGIDIEIGGGKIKIIDGATEIKAEDGLLINGKYIKEAMKKADISISDLSTSLIN
jgi:hypothetical protein